MRGPWHPCHREQTRESRKVMPQKSTGSTPRNSVTSVTSVVKKTPAKQSRQHRARAKAQAATGQSKQGPGGILYPSPPTPLPFQGRGGTMRSPQPQKTTSIRENPCSSVAPKPLCCRSPKPPCCRSQKRSRIRGNSPTIRHPQLIQLPAIVEFPLPPRWHSPPGISDSSQAERWTKQYGRREC